MTTQPPPFIKNFVLVLSGKGGVGKSTVSVQLANALASQGFRVGVLDVDLCGPSIPKLLNVDQSKVHQSSAGWIPVVVDKECRLCCMSIGFLLASKHDAVVWRGPKKTAMIRQFLQDVYWGDLDYLVIDTPPGTSDEHLAIAEYLKSAMSVHAIMVTTPQEVALSDVRREIDFCRTVSIPILGLIENMSGYVCPHCAECTRLFSEGGGEALAAECNIPFLVRLPLDPSLSGRLIENSDETNVTVYPYHTAFKTVVEKLKAIT